MLQHVLGRIIFILSLDIQYDFCSGYAFGQFLTTFVVLFKVEQAEAPSSQCRLILYCTAVALQSVVYCYSTHILNRAYMQLCPPFFTRPASSIVATNVGRSPSSCNTYSLDHYTILQSLSAVQCFSKHQQNLVGMKTCHSFATYEDKRS